MHDGPQASSQATQIMSSPSLAELLRQRALVSQHLAWLDAKIASASESSALATETPPSPPASPTIALPAPESTGGTVGGELPATTPENEPTEIVSEAVALANQRADEIIAQHGQTDRFDPAATRRGCILFAVFIGCLLVLGVVAIYYFQYSGK